MTDQQTNSDQKWLNLAEWHENEASRFRRLDPAEDMSAPGNADLHQSAARRIYRTIAGEDTTKRG